MNRRNFLKAMVAISAYGLVHGQLAKAMRRGQVSSDQPNVLLLVLDTYSAYHASLYGYARETTPNLARFAERATVYHRHYTAGNFTTPGTASLLTGTYPWRHRAFHINGTVADTYQNRQLFSALAGGNFRRMAYSHNSLVLLLLNQFRADIDRYVPARELALFDDLVADQLFPNDFEAAFLAEKLTLPKGDNVMPSTLFISLLDGFRRTRHIQEARLANAAQFPRGMPRADEDTRYFFLEDAFDWLANELETADQPTFMYAHLYPPHGPYNARHEFIDHFRGDGFAAISKPYHVLGENLSEESLNRSRQQYDDFLLYTDTELGRFFDLLVSQGNLENTIVIVTSDHGQLFERGTHGHITPLLYEPVIRVPLLIAKPGQVARQDIFTPTSCIDLLPTLAQLTGTARPAWAEGELLPESNELSDEQAPRPIFALDAKQNAKHGPLNQFSLAMIKGDIKIIGYFGYDTVAEGYEMYRLDEDPDELNNLYDSDDPIALAMRGELQEWIAKANDGV